MPRTTRGIEGLIEGACKIRKRGVSSSSSSSSLLQNYRFKRAILVRKKGGGSPSPSVLGVAESFREKRAPVSARKLAATLWEMNNVGSPSRRVEVMRGRERISRPGSVRSGSLPRRLSDPPHSPVLETTDRSGSSSLRRIISANSRRLRLNEHNGGGFDSRSNASLMEIETRSRAQTPAGSIVLGGTKSLLKDLSNGLATSKELLKILSRIWGLEEQHSTSISIISALNTELEQARAQANRLIKEQRSDQNEINHIMKQFADEKAAWKNKEQERTIATIQSIAGELDVERKLRRQTENLNKQLSRELAETKALLMKMVKEVERERKVRGTMQRIYDELDMGTGEDGVEEEELRRESAKVREGVKPSRSKLHLKEKNVAVDELRNKVEKFLKTKRKNETKGGFHNRGEMEVEERRWATHLGLDRNVEEGLEDGTKFEEDSTESDLHSIELNMDNNNKNYRWNYGNRAAQEDQKSVSVEQEESRGRNSKYEKILKGRGSLDRGVSEGIEWGFSTEDFQRRGDVSDRGRLSECNSYLEKHAMKQDYDDRTQRYKSVKGLRDHILSGSRTAFTRNFASPTRQWSQPGPSRDLVDADRGSSKVAEMVKGIREKELKARLVEAKGERQHSMHKQFR